MGQTTSHNKQLRNDYIKSTMLNQQSSTIASNYPTEDYPNEDEDIICPSINSKSSYVNK